MKRIKKLVAVTLIPFMVLFNFSLSALGADAGTEIEHSPVETAQSGQRIGLEAEVTDPSGVDVVRAYFKALEAQDYAFVEMANSGGDDYAGTLPAPAKGAQAIDYLILVKNGANQVVKSQTFRIEVEDSDEAVAAMDRIQVYTELAEAPESITGFADNIAVDVVESAAKFGVVVGLYDVSSAGTGGGAGAAAGGSTSGGGAGAATAGGAAAGGGAAAAGTVVATSAAGASVATVAVGAAVVAGGAAAASSSSSDSEDQETQPTQPTQPGSCPYTGSWGGTWQETWCDGSRDSGSWIATVDSNCNLSLSDSDGGTLGGTINPSTGILQMSGSADECGTFSGTATFSGSSVRGSWTYSGGGGGSLSGSKR